MPRFWFFLLLTVLFAAQTVAGRAQSPQSVENAMRGYDAALCSGTPQEVASWYTAEGQLLLPGLAPLRGPAAIQAFLAPMQAGSKVQSVVTRSDVVAMHGNDADQWGAYREVAGPRGKAPRTYSGRYAALWHWKGGHWHLFRLMMQPL